MNRQYDKERSERIALYKFYLSSKYKSSFVDYDSMTNTHVIWNGYQDPETETVLRSGILDVVAYPRLELRHIVEVVGNLDAGGYLKHIVTPRVVERIVQVERQPSAEEKAAAEKKASKERFEQGHANGYFRDADSNRTELDWDDEHKPEVLTEPQKQALNERNRRIDAVINETLSAISSYTGPTHARTYDRREQLRATFNKFKGEVSDIASAEKLQRTIDAKIASFDSNPSVR